MSSTFSDLQDDVVNALHPAIKAQTAYSAAEVIRQLNRAYADFVKRTRCLKDYVDVKAVEDRRIYTSGNGIIATTIAFVDSDPDTITDSGSGFVTAGFQSYQQIVVNGSTSNNGIYTAETIAAGTLTLASTDSLTAEVAGDTVRVVPKLSYIYDPYEIRLIKSGESNQGYLLNPYPGGHGNLPRENVYSGTPEYFWTRGLGTQGKFEFGTWPILNNSDDTIRIHAYMYPMIDLVADTDVPLIRNDSREALPLFVLWKMYKQYAYIDKDWMYLSREYRNEYLEYVDTAIGAMGIDSEDGFPSMFDVYSESNW